MDAKILATDIVRKLNHAGYTAYFAGGWVRDYLMGHPSEDIDIATDAPPEKILDLFPHTILVGLAFGVVIVVSEGHQFEVATFRRDIDYVDGRKPSQIELSSPQEDASRRDFTINGMFYDPLQEVVHDYVQGTEDLKHQIIRTIGDPYQRFNEDRLRMIRAVRFAARFAFHIDEDTQEAIRANADSLLPAVAMERIWNEFGKMSKYPRFDMALIDMHRFELLPCIFPELKGVHLNEIKQRVAPFAHFSSNTPPILYLMALFPDANSNDIIEICRYLRTSQAEANLATFLLLVKQCVNKEQSWGLVDKLEWSHLYAQPSTQMCLHIIAANLPELEREPFLLKHQQRVATLDKHIQRLISKKPLVNARLLQAEGIIPGKLMGVLLKEAERLAIIDNMDNAEEIVERLKASSLWPTG